MALFDTQKERLAVGAIIMASILFITAFACLWLIERRDASERQQEREQLGSLVRESLGTMDSTLQELVIQTRTQERIIDRQQRKKLFWIRPIVRCVTSTKCSKTSTTAPCAN